METHIGVGMSEIISNKDHDILVTGGTIGNSMDVVDHLGNSKVTIVIVKGWIILNGSIVIEMLINFEAFWVSVGLRCCN